MPRSPRSGLPLPRLLAPLLAVLTALTALALTVPSSSASSATPAAAAARAGAITGWADAPTTARAGSAYVARVRVSGGERPVRLQRRVGTTWRTVATTRSSSTGLARLRWTTPTSGTRVALRVLAPRSGSRSALVTGAKSVVVRRVVSVAGLSAALRDVLGLVNQARSTGYTCGGTRFPAVPALRVEPRLTAAAAKFARRMATENFFAHDSPDGADPGDRIGAEGYRWRAYGENIAAGQPTAASVVDAWLHSDGHCANIMSGAFTEIGLGYAYDADSTYGRYWVQDFGAR